MTISTLPLMIEGLHIATPDGRLLLENGGFEMAAGELVLLIGPSGCGKSTLINALSGLLGDDGARWDLRGQLVLNGQHYDLARERCDVGGLVFQGNALFDDLSAAQNLAIAIDHAGAPEPGLPTLLAALLQDVDPHRRVSSLSGGQRQRVAIARTVLAKRPILLFDEPNSGLDTHAAQRLGELIKELCREMKIPALVVAHHFDDLVLLADKVLIFDPVQRVLHQVPPDRECIERALHRIGQSLDEQKVSTPAQVHEIPVATWESRMHHRPAQRWFLYYLLQYFWVLTVAPLTLLYVLSGAAVISFVSIWFGFNYDVLGDFMRSFVHDDALMGIGFVITTINVPLICCILITARNNAIITADMGNRVYSAQLRAMRNLHIPGRAYLSAAILLNMVCGSLFMMLLSTGVATWFSFQTWQLLFPDQPFELWREHYFRLFIQRPEILWENIGWILLKTVVGIVLASSLALYTGFSQKRSVIDINQAIARSIVYGISIVLLVHAGIAVLQL
ncbi:MAG TPA: ABC transporter [Gammaproteobacteria bacterium]|nr:ABC transporter [Gammaproteobacteria bacterium]